jgi:hypothetical protein
MISAFDFFPSGNKIRLEFRSLLKSVLQIRIEIEFSDSDQLNIKACISRSANISIRQTTIETLGIRMSVNDQYFFHSASYFTAAKLSGRKICAGKILLKR